MKRIGILTLPVNYNCGGRIQAFALQDYLRGIGYDAHLVNLQFAPPKGSKDKIKSFIRWCILSYQQKDLFNESIQPATPKLYPSDDLVHLNEMFDGFIVGSDQVWRKQYAKGFLNPFFLDFADEHHVKRVSYAASFGVSDWQFTQEETNKLSKLIGNFHAVSVREDSAVRLCQEFFGVDAKHVVDPTMLLDKERYLRLVEKECTQNFNGDLLYYIIDMNESMHSLVQSYAQELAMVPFTANTPASRGTGSWIQRYYPRVTNWVKSFVAAKFVITDSFHGSVLSILFNRPFLALGNSRRGNTRFMSLLKMFNLEDRLVPYDDAINLEKANTPIDWKAVNEILSHKREESKEFLRLALEDY